MGNFIKVVQEPSYKSVEEYKDYLKRNSPNPNLKYELMDADIKCTCCTQKAPHTAAAYLKILDETPYGDKFGVNAGIPSSDHGETLWICADCFTNGVRPKYKYFGNIKWNNTGRRIKKRAEEKGRHPW